MVKIEDIEELIRSSGNNFHSRVARWFSENKWHVVVSPYYMDQSLGKAREIDLIVEKEHPIYGSFGKVVGHVVIRLFVECKFIPAPSVFWFSIKDGVSARDLVYRSGPFRKDNSYSEQHHYLTGSQMVAKLFASGSSKASENEPFYKALNQVLNAMVSMQGRDVSIPVIQRNRAAKKVVLEFPVIVCSSFEQLYFVGFDKESSPERIAENFQLEVRYAYVSSTGRNCDEYFLIDVLEFDQLGKYQEALDKDVKAASVLGFSA